VAAGAPGEWIPISGDVAAIRASIALPVPTDTQTVRDVALNVDESPRSPCARRLLPVDTAFVVPRFDHEDGIA